MSAIAEMLEAEGCQNPEVSCEHSGLPPEEWCEMHRVEAEWVALRAERDAALARAEQAERDLRRAEARAAVVVWGLSNGWQVTAFAQRWAWHVPFAPLETDPVLTCPRLTDSPLADVTPEIVDAIAATHGCPEVLRVWWEGVRHAV